MIPTQDSYNVVDIYGIAQYGGGQYVEVSTIAGWQTKWPYYVARYRHLGWTDAQIGRATPFCASMNDLAWATSPNGVTLPNNSYATIIVGHGQWAANMAIDWVYGRIIGAGIANTYPFAGAPRGAGGTEVVMHPDKWIVDPACKVNIPELGPQDNYVYAAFRSVVFNAEGMVGAYHERAGIDQIHINGQNKTFTPGRLVVGFLAWDLGTGSEIGNVYGNAIDVLMLATRGTPGHIRKLSGMGGGVALVMLLGAVDAPYDFESIECDDFPTVFFTRAQWGREAGARIQFDVIKIETGVTPESRNPWTGTIIADLKGRNIIDGGIVNFAEAQVNVGDLIVINDQHANGSQPNLVKFTLGKWNVEANLIHETGGNVYPSPGGFPWDGQEVFYYRSGNTRKMQVNRTDVAPLPGVVGYKSRLGFQRWNGTAWAPAFNHATGSPAFSYADADGSGTVQPPPTGCTWVLGTPGAWGACVNGQQSRTTPYVPSVAGCTPTTAKPADAVETRACTPTPSVLIWATTFGGADRNLLVATTGANIAPVQTWSGLGSAPNGTGRTTNNTCFGWPTGAASAVVLLGVTITGPFAYQAITPNHVIYPNGMVYYRSAGVDTATGVTVTSGTKVARLSLPCPGGVLTGVLGGAINTGSTAVMSIEGMEVYR